MIANSSKTGNFEQLKIYLNSLDSKYVNSTHTFIDKICRCPD